MIWTPYDWLNKGYSFYMAPVVIIRMGVALELKHVVETNLIRVSYHCISYYLHFNIPFNWLYTQAKRQRASVIKVGVDGMGVLISKCLKEELA